MGTFEQCPLKFKYSKIDLMQEDPTEATLMGNFVHDVLEALYHVESTYRTEDEAKLLAAQLWENGWSDRVKPWVRGDEALRMFRWKSWWCIQNLWKIEEPTLPEISPPPAETETPTSVDTVVPAEDLDRDIPLRIITPTAPAETPEENK